MQWSFCFAVSGVPATKGSWRFFGRGRVKPDNPRLKAWQSAIRKAGLDTVNTAPEKPDTSGSFPVAVIMTFTLPRPKSHTTPGGKLRRGYPYSPIMAASGDLDKLTRAAFDALQGVFYENDSQVIHAVISKAYQKDGNSCGVYVKVSRIS